MVAREPIQINGGWQVQTFRIAYLLLLGSSLTNIIHQYRHQLCYVIDSGGICAILGRGVYGLSLGFCLVKPLPGHGVYYVEDA